MLYASLQLLLGMLYLLEALWGLGRNGPDDPDQLHPHVPKWAERLHRCTFGSMGVCYFSIAVTVMTQIPPAH